MPFLSDSFDTTVEVSSFEITFPRSDYRVKIELDDRIEIVSAYLSPAEARCLRDTLDQHIARVELMRVAQPELAL
jgi:predicted DNA-binding protein